MKEMSLRLGTELLRKIRRAKNIKEGQVIANEPCPTDHEG